MGQDAGLLAGKGVVVSGGGAGIGAGIAVRFAAEGGRVLLVDRDGAAAEATANTIVATGGSAEAFVGDVTETATIAAVVERAGCVDVLVNNVGDYRPAGLFAESSESDWQALYDSNLLHVFRLTHALLPSMLERGSGSIVNVSTVEAFRGIPAGAVYSAFKAGVSQFTRSLAVEVAGDGVRVNAIAPDVTQTPQIPYDRWVSESERELIPSWVPLGRFGQPEDVAAVALFLASEESRFVTGHTIPVDGGTLAASGWYKRLGKKAWTNRPRKP